MRERPNTVSGLVAKRKELRAAIRKAIDGIRHIDATIALFSPTRRKPAKRHQFTRFIITSFRDAGGPVTPSALVEAWIASEGLVLSHRSLANLRKRMSARFRYLKAQGVIEEVGKLGDRKTWLLVRDYPGALGSDAGLL
jgi:hypothetical protein